MSPDVRSHCTRGTTHRLSPEGAAVSEANGDARTYVRAHVYARSPSEVLHGAVVARVKPCRSETLKRLARAWPRSNSHEAVAVDARTSTSIETSSSRLPWAAPHAKQSSSHRRPDPLRNHAHPPT